MSIIFPVLFIAENLTPWQCALASLQTTTRQKTEQKHANNHNHAKLTHRCTIIMPYQWSSQ